MKHLHARTNILPSHLLHFYDLFIVYQNPITVNTFMDQIVDSFIWAFTKHTDGTHNIEARDSRLLGDFTIAGNTHTSFSYVHNWHTFRVRKQWCASHFHSLLNLSIYSTQYHIIAVQLIDNKQYGSYILGYPKWNGRWKQEGNNYRGSCRISFIPFHLFGSHDAICPSNLPFWSSPSRGVRGSISVSST